MAEWSFEAIDKLTDPMRLMGKSSRDLEHDLATTTKELERLERQERLFETLKIEDPIKRQAAALRMLKVDLEHVNQSHEHTHKSGSLLSKVFSGEAYFAVEMAEKITHLTHKVYEFGKELFEAGLEATQFKNSSLATLELMVDSREAAEEEFEVVGMMARRSAMTKADIMGQYKELFSFTDRYDTDATENLIAAASDVQKALGTGAQQAFLTGVKNIEAMGGLTERTIRLFRETGVATPKRIYEALAAELHTTTDGAKQLMRAGRVSQEQSINTLLELVNQRVDKGKGLGAYTVERSAVTVTDQLKNLHEAWEELFEGVDTAPVADALAKLANMLREGQPAGEKLRDVLHEAFTDITKVIEFAADHAEGFSNKLEKMLHAAEAVGGFLESHPILANMILGAAGGAAVGGGLGAVFGAAGGLGYGMGAHTGDASLAADKARADQTQRDIDEMNRRADELQEKLNTKLAANEQLESAMQRSGIKAGDGFMQGLADKIESKEVSQLIQTQVTDAIDRALDAHSPSRVTRKRGRWAAEGMLLGWDDVMTSPSGFGGAGFRASVGGAAPAPFASPSFSQGVGGARHVTASVSVSVKFDGSAPSNPQQLADMSAHIEAATERGVLKAFENLAVQN